MTRTIRSNEFRMRRVRTWSGVAAIALLAGLSFGFAPAHDALANGLGDAGAGEEKAPEVKKSVDAADVYYGDAREWSKPAEVDAALVYAEIEEYKQIQDEKLEASDARYGVLMSKATKKFKCAVRKAAKDGEYDLVAKIGAVKGVDSVPTITAAVIGKL